MNKNLKLLILLILVIMIAQQQKKQGAQYGDVLLVTNEDSLTSLQISDYFKTHRGQMHQVYLNTSDDEIVSFTVFNQTIRKPIEQYLIQNNLEDQIKYIVTTKGVPLKVFASRTDWTPYFSIDSALTLILSTNSEKIGLMITTNENTERLEPKRIINPMYKQNHSNHDMYLVTRLTGYTNEDVFNIIPNSTCVYPNGKLLLDRAMKTYSGYATWDLQIEEAYFILSEMGVNVYFENTTTFVTDMGNLDGYVSWGSNDGHNVADSSTWNLSFNQGSIGETAVSSGGRSFKPGTTYGQSLVADLIANGLTGAKAYVYEPYLSAVAEPEILFQRYYSGYNLAESFYMSSAYLNWMDVVVGDPKLQICEEPIQKPKEKSNTLLYIIGGVALLGYFIIR